MFTEGDKHLYRLYNPDETSQSHLNKTCETGMMYISWLLSMSTWSMNIPPKWYQLRASSESVSCSTGVWTTLRVMSFTVQVHQISLEHA